MEALAGLLLGCRWCLMCSDLAVHVKTKLLYVLALAVLACHMRICARLAMHVIDEADRVCGAALVRCIPAELSAYMVLSGLRARNMVQDDATFRSGHDCTPKALCIVGALSFAAVTRLCLLHILRFPC